MESRRITILNVHLDILSEDQFETRILALASADRPRHVMLITSWDVIKAVFDKSYRAMLETASLVLPVSKALPAQARFLQKSAPVRYMPFDFLIKTLGVLENKGRSLYVLGARPAFLQRADSNLRRTFPGLKIVGRHCGYYTRAFEPDILRAISKASPACLLVGGGVRGGNRWIHRNKRNLPAGLCLCDRHTLDVISGRRKKVSRETFARGHEYLGELLRHPWRVVRFPLYLFYGVLLILARLRRD